MGKGSFCLGKLGKFPELYKIDKSLVSDSLIPTIGSLATFAEIIFAVFLIVGFKTELFAKLSGLLLLLFALSMTFSTGIKGAFDYSVFSASAGAFALSLMKEKYWELDSLITKQKTE
ncbi:DoxX family protein [Maribacter litopenaei]|uniref:DoxX family protein n=1 Tax=Maribacter litopenaei TaxID=2976127 RepID=A0ABY5Y3Y9_9FLAO|nr:DoxX family protein [Maribacter litopenaei]UWX53725.1 DoxX family protein [Maribacter litopenaei]